MWVENEPLQVMEGAFIAQEVLTQVAFEVPRSAHGFDDLKPQES
jgi:hypothetical protein